jgi:Zn-dependent protease
MTDGTPVRCCRHCGTELGTVLECPVCHRLVHAEELKQHAADATAATQAGDARGALAAWRTALELLPPETRQYETIARRVRALSEQVAQQPAQHAPTSHDSDRGAARPRRRVKLDGAAVEESSAGRKGGILAAVAGVGFLLWKLKFAVAFLFTKGKLLLLGLSKAGTVSTMMLSLGVYWAAWGWVFAAGIVASIYVHEMGHVAALRRFGTKASAPMFIPGVGALIRLKQYPASPAEDARVGLAGPIWGLVAAAVCYAVGYAAGWGSWLAIGTVAAWINLFNLLPIWQLDGARGFTALSRGQRWIVLLTIAVMWAVTREGLLVLIAIAALFQTIAATPAEKPDTEITLWFVALVVALSGLAALPTGALPA